jgi:hypothetical protein
MFNPCLLQLIQTDLLFDQGIDRHRRSDQRLIPLHQPLIAFQPASPD